MPLTLEQRRAAVLQLHVHEGCKTTKIAQRLGVHRKAIQNDLKRLGLTRFTVLPDAELDERVKLVLEHTHPALGKVAFEASLIDAFGARVKYKDIRASLRRLSYLRGPPRRARAHTHQRCDGAEHRPPGAGG